MRKTILLYIQAPFMDLNVEYIKLVRDKHNAHVLIELPQTQLRSNIFNINTDLNKYEPITSYWDVAAEWQIEYLKEYFEGCASVNFVVYKPKGALKSLYVTTKKVVAFIKALKADYYHFDDFSAREFFILPFLNFNKKLILNIHDPQAHHGEFEWKRYLIRKIFYKKAVYYLTFSNYSKTALEAITGTKNVVVFYLLPYTIFNKFRTDTTELPDDEKLISFIGRISPYKGIDMLLDAVEEVAKIYPKQKFYIGGRLIKDYDPDFRQFAADNERFKLVKGYLSNSDIANTMFRSKLVVCPYIEATQSGVVMTAYAMDCPLLVTRTGGMQEYVLDDRTGLITNDITKEALVEKMLLFLKDNKYKTMHDNMKNDVFIHDLRLKNINVIDEIYQ